MRSLLSILIPLSVLHKSVFCVPQGAPTAITAAPDLLGPTTAAASCGGCYVVADVAAVVWYTGIITNTAATKVVSIGLNNGSRTTSTEIVENQEQITFNPAVTVPAESPIALTSIQYGSTADVGGAILTSPTAYNVFSAYSITSSFFSSGQCVTESGSSLAVSPAFSESLTSGTNEFVVGTAAEQAFINYLGLTCSGGGIVPQTTAHVQVSNLTTVTTTTVSRLTPVPVTVSTTITGTTTLAAASSTAAPLSSASASAAASTTVSSSTLSSSTFASASSSPGSSSKSSTLSSSFPSSSSSPSSPSLSQSQTSLSATLVIVGSPSASTAVPEIIIGSSTFTPASSGAPIVLGNSTISLGPTGTVTFSASPNASISVAGIIPFTGDASRGDRSQWLLWGAGALGILGATWVL